MSNMCVVSSGENVETDLSRNRLQLVSEAETLPAKRQVLEAVTVIIERIGNKVRTF
jgi:hypothetical protein